MQTSILFWDVDTQADFIYPGGKLYVPGAESIVPTLKRLTEWASKNEVLVVASACAHQEDDAEFAQFPPHCLVGTPGQQKIPETQLKNALIVPNRRVEVLSNLSSYQQIILEKQQLNVFSNPNTDEVLDQLGPVHEVILYGVVSEICVAYAARELIRRGYHLQVVTDAIRHLNQTKAQTFLSEVSESGSRLVSAGELLPGLERRWAA
jgi:nicotinamidase/pyrazinamidase